MAFLTHEDGYTGELTLSHATHDDGQQPLVRLHSYSEVYLTRDDVMIVIEALAGWMEETEDPKP